MSNFSISTLIFNLIDVLAVILPILLAVAFMTIIERKQLAAHQRRVGPVKWCGKLLLWDKLPNSGDTLKLMIPSSSRKAICGWTNHSGTVISHKMSENKMGYRGSKSDLIIKSVKEQRVDGSWVTFNFKNKKVPLRSTLMGGESRYQVKIPSNQINKIKSAFFWVKRQRRGGLIKRQRRGVLFFHLNLLKNLLDIEHYFYFGMIWSPRHRNKI